MSREAGQTWQVITNLSEEIRTTISVGAHYDSSVIIILGNRLPILKGQRIPVDV